MTNQLLLVSDEASSFTAKASGASVSGGAFVYCVSGETIGSADLSAYKFGDILVENADDASDDYKTVVGIAANDAATNGAVKVYTEGLFIVRAGEGITPGARLTLAEDTDQWEVDVCDNDDERYQIGKSLTACNAADDYIVMLLRI